VSQNRKEFEKQLRAPDQFQTGVAHAFDWMVKNKNLVMVVVVPLAVMALGYAGWGYYAETQKANRIEALGKVEAGFRNENKVVFDQQEGMRKEVSSLDEQIGKEADAKKKDGLNAKKAALQGQMEAMKADHTASIAGYKAFFEANTGNPEGWAAGAKSAALMIGKKDFAGAKELLGKVIDASNKEIFYQTQCRIMLMGVLEELGDLKAATEVADVLAGLADDTQKPFALLQKARFEIGQDQKDAAKKTIDQLIEKHGSSAEADTAKTMKALILGS